jgi:hypothetical protein
LLSHLIIENYHIFYFLLFKIFSFTFKLLLYQKLLSFISTSLMGFFDPFNGPFQPPSKFINIIEPISSWAIKYPPPLNII